MIPITPQSRYDALVKLREGKIGREIFSDRDDIAAKYRGLDWSVELRAAAGDEAAIDELYQQFDIERYGAPGQKKEVLI